MAELYLCRHAKSAYNSKPKSNPDFKGKLGGDAPLIDEGWEQAEEHKKFFSEIHLDAIITSTKIRAKETGTKIGELHMHLAQVVSDLCAELSDYLGADIKPDPEYPSVVPVQIIDEVGFGSCENMKREFYSTTFADIKAARNANKWAYVPPGEGGKSYALVVDRVKPLTEWLSRKEGTFVVVGHRAVNRCILHNLLNLSPEETVNFLLPHEAVFHFEDTAQPIVRHHYRSQWYEGHVVQKK